jgi:4-hydroxybenzoate polyprenyltransferase/phosphoserine phosphatase
MVLLSSPAPPADPVPLVVDLDGTLLHTDTLVELLFDVARRHPLQLLGLPAWLAGGRANLKRQLALRASVDDLSVLPLADDLLTALRALKGEGRYLVLATGADAKVAQPVADELGLFDAVLASDGRVNLSGTVKRDRLVAEFGEGGFDYAGNSWRDLPVWAAARRALLVRPTPRLAAAAARVTEVERSFDDRPGWPDYIGAMRVQHWLKNLLLFVPLLAAHQLYEAPKLLAALLAFACFSLAASGVYLLNDLFDLPADRRHPHKKHRALASGRIPLLHGLLLVPALWGAAALLATALPGHFLGVLGGYLALNVAYSIRLKRYPIVDTLVLAVGYSLRIYAGSLAVAVDVSPWLLVCSAALFFGLALLKRYAELVTLRPRLGAGARVHGYRLGDATLIAGLGTAADSIAVVLLALYPVVEAPAAPHLTVWLLSALLLFWSGHMWLMAHHGRIHDDPVAFALRDPLSRVFGAAIAALLLLPR